MQRSQCASQRTATPSRTSPRTSAGAGANKASAQLHHDLAPRPYRSDSRSRILGTSSAPAAVGTFPLVGAQPLMSSAVTGGPAAHADAAASVRGYPPSSRGTLPTELERPPSSRPPIPTPSIRRLTTIADLQALADPPSQLPVPSYTTSEVVLSPGAEKINSGALGLSRPHVSSNVLPGPGSRSAARPQSAAPAAVPDELCCGAEAAEEPAACTGVTVFCMMPLDTVKPKC